MNLRCTLTSTKTARSFKEMLSVALKKILQTNHRMLLNFTELLTDRSKKMTL